MEQRAIVDVFHAYMHRDKHLFNFWEKGMSIDDFILNNQDALRKISKKFLTDYHLAASQAPQILLRKSIAAYMKGEGIPIK